MNKTEKGISFIDPHLVSLNLRGLENQALKRIEKLK
jgi:hypothetical protein